MKADVKVLGAGTWGIALARHLSLNGHDVCVWSALEQEIDELGFTRKHKNLPGMEIPQEIRFEKSLEKTLTENTGAERRVIVFAVPSIFVRNTAKSAAPFLKDSDIVVDVAKGIEEGTLLTMTGIIKDELEKAGTVVGGVVALSGPTHAEEVARDIPTTIVSASKDEASAIAVQEVFSGRCMRVYTNDDVLGVELCGAVKNIIALACGISTGLGYGDNTKAAIMTRGMAEIVRLGTAMGASEKTFYGLAGMGDLIVTATSVHSRNNRCGMLIGQGHSLEEAKSMVGMVVEGINALPAVMELAAKYEVEMPIIEVIGDVVFNGADPHASVDRLMGRVQKAE